MKRIASTILLLLALALSSLAQNAAPTPDTCDPKAPAAACEPNIGQHVSINVSYLKWANGGKGSASQAIATTALLPILPNWKIGYALIDVPGAFQIHGGLVRYDEKLGHLLHPKNALVNLNAIRLFLEAGAGVKRDAIGQSPKAAFGLGGGFEFNIGQAAGGNLTVGVKVGQVFVPGNVGPKRFGFTSATNLQPAIGWTR